jgi:hypothetical protein
MADPRNPLTCAECGAQPVRSRGRCSRCYQALWRKEQREGSQPGNSCAQCHERNASRKGLCDRCYQARRRRELPEQTSAIARAYHARNRATELARMRHYYYAHAEQVKAYRHNNRASERAYNQEHKDEINARRRAYYQQHKDEINAQRRAAREPKLPPGEG